MDTYSFILVPHDNFITNVIAALKAAGAGTMSNYTYVSNGISVPVSTKWLKMPNAENPGLMEFTIPIQYKNLFENS